MLQCVTAWLPVRQRKDRTACAHEICMCVVYLTTMCQRGPVAMRLFCIFQRLCCDANRALGQRSWRADEFERVRARYCAGADYIFINQLGRI